MNVCRKLSSLSLQLLARSMDLVLILPVMLFCKGNTYNKQIYWSKSFVRKICSKTSALIALAHRNKYGKHQTLLKLHQLMYN